MSLGLKQAGFSVLAGADYDAYSVGTHKANIGGLGYLGDLGDPSDFLRHLDAWGISRVDLVAGGVPCQPFSRAGRSKIRSLVRDNARPAEDDRILLWRALVEVVAYLRPKAVLLENVPDLAVWDSGTVLASLREQLSVQGYSSTVAVLGACDFGVPQHRERLFLVALEPGRPFQWPKPLDGHSTLRDAIGDLPEVPPAQREERVAYEGPHSDLQRALRVGVPPEDCGWVYDHITRDLRVDDAEAFAFLRPGESYAHLPQRLQRYRSDIFSDKYYRLRWDSVSRSITAHIAKDAYWYIHPDQNRTLSIREAARLQTFPDWFRFSGEPSHRFRQIGNAVPPLLGRAIGAQIVEALAAPRARARKQPAGCFRARIMDWHVTNPGPQFWRRGGYEPWPVLLAESLLARTRPSQLRARYDALVKATPTPTRTLQDPAMREVLADAGLERFGPRIRDLAQEVVSKHGGKVPDKLADLIGLRGVTPLAASAVLTFAFRQHSLLVTAGTERVIRRFCGTASLGRWEPWTRLYDLAGLGGADSEFNDALASLALTICRSGVPGCADCPVSIECSSVLAGSLQSMRP